MKKHKLAVIILFIIGILPVAAQDKASSLSRKEIQKIESARHPFIMSFSIGPKFSIPEEVNILNISGHAQMLLPSSTGGYLSDLHATGTPIWI